MPPWTWWSLHAVQSLALMLAVLFSMGSARRTGGHTLYGNMLFLLGLGFFWLLMAEAVFVGRQGLGVWGGPGSFNDLLGVMGWALLITSVFLFVERFSPIGRGPWRSRIRLVVHMAVPVVLLLVLFYGWLSPVGADPDAWVRVPYLVFDGMALGLIVGGIDRLLRLRQGALGRLYIFLAVAILLKTAGDVQWAYLAARDLGSLTATAFYPLSGLMAVIGLGLHMRHMKAEELPEAPHLPWLRPEQRQLAALARRLRGIAGGYAARTALRAAAAVFERRGTPCRIDGLSLESEADDAVWAEAVQAMEQAAVDLLGVSGQEAVEQQPPGGTAWRG